MSSNIFIQVRIILNSTYFLQHSEKITSAMVNRLADILLEFQGKSKNHNRNLLELYYGVVLKEWVCSHGHSLTRKETLILAEAHFEVWLRQGIASDSIHLQKARDLYHDFITKTGQPAAVPIATWLQYCRILMYLGDATTASKAITTVVQVFENDPEIPSYLFIAGAIFKALGMREQANNYFFEATQIGPPKLFTKMEMMLIISRVLEEMDADSDGNEGAYKMVYEHLMMEGHIDPDLDYDDWLSDSKTWVDFGDKCAIYQMYSLAADFYSLGILKDPNAFKKPMLWYRFAKSCSRCGRHSDAELGIVVSRYCNIFSLINGFNNLKYFQNKII